LKIAELFPPFSTVAVLFVFKPCLLSNGKNIVIRNVALFCRAIIESENEFLNPYEISLMYGHITAQMTTLQQIITYSIFKQCKYNNATVIAEKECERER